MDIFSVYCSTFSESYNLIVGRCMCSVALFPQCQFLHQRLIPCVLCPLNSILRFCWKCPRCYLPTLLSFHGYCISCAMYNITGLCFLLARLSNLWCTKRFYKGSIVNVPDISYYRKLTPTDINATKINEEYN